MLPLRRLLVKFSAAEKDRNVWECKGLGADLPLKGRAPVREDITVFGEAWPA